MTALVSQLFIAMIPIDRKTFVTLHKKFMISIGGAFSIGF